MIKTFSFVSVSSAAFATFTIAETSLFNHVFTTVFARKHFVTEFRRLRPRECFVNRSFYGYFAPVCEVRKPTFWGHAKMPWAHQRLLQCTRNVLAIYINQILVFNKIELGLIGNLKLMLISVQGLLSQICKVYDICVFQGYQIYKGYVSYQICVYQSCYLNRFLFQCPSQ